MFRARHLLNSPHDEARKDRPPWEEKRFPGGCLVAAWGRERTERKSRQELTDDVLGSPASFGKLRHAEDGSRKGASKKRNGIGSWGLRRKSKDH